MPSVDSLFNAFVTLLVTIDPPGLAPLFLALTAGMNRSQRTQVGLRASIIGFLVLSLFAIAALRSCPSSASRCRPSGWRAGCCCSSSPSR